MKRALHWSVRRVSFQKLEFSVQLDANEIETSPGPQTKTNQEGTDFRKDFFPIQFAEDSEKYQSAYRKFSKLGLSAALNKYAASRYESPTQIQEETIPLLLKGSSALISSETGSGKTLAFMLPLIVRMQAAEARRAEEHDTSKGPRLVMFAPTRELSSQLMLQAKSVSHIAKFRARLWGNQKLKLSKDVVPDLVISSTMAFEKEMRWNPALIEAVVIDECDAMLMENSGFTEEINNIVRKLKPECQIVCVGATALKSDCLKWLRRMRPDAEVVKTQGAGQLPKTIKMHMISVKDNEGYNKHPALERAIAPFLSFPKFDNTASSPRCIIFCNSVSSCRSTAHALSERYSDKASCYCLHGEMRPLQRESNWNDFISDQASEVKKLKILVCTDLSSRGIDVQNIQHVVIFDLPSSLPDFLHRAGRTGRAGNSGDVTFIVGRGEKEQVTELFRKQKS